MNFAGTNTCVMRGCRVGGKGVEGGGRKVDIPDDNNAQADKVGFVDLNDAC